MKVEISKDEWYPVYIIDIRKNDYDNDIEISQELYDQYTNLMKEFDLMQQVLSSLKKKA